MPGIVSWYLTWFNTFNSHYLPMGAGYYNLFYWLETKSLTDLPRVMQSLSERWLRFQDLSDLRARIFNHDHHPFSDLRDFCPSDEMLISWHILFLTYGRTSLLEYTSPSSLTQTPSSSLRYSRELSSSEAWTFRNINLSSSIFD